MRKKYIQGQIYICNKTCAIITVDKFPVRFSKGKIFVFYDEGYCKNVFIYGSAKIENRRKELSYWNLNLKDFELYFEQISEHRKVYKLLKNR